MSILWKLEQIEILSLLGLMEALLGKSYQQNRFFNYSLLSVLFNNKIISFLNTSFFKGNFLSFFRNLNDGYPKSFYISVMSLLSMVNVILKE